MKSGSHIIRIIGLIIFALIFYFAGYLVGHKNFVFEQNYYPKLVNKELKKPQEVNFGSFWNAWEIVSEKYIGNYSTEELVYGAIKGMIEALGDPYSVVVKEDDNQKFLDDLSGEIEGIGAELSMRDDRLTVIAPLDGSPADKAGLKAQDKILEIDGQDTTGLDLDQAVSQIRGKAGTEVRLLINRESFFAPQEFKIKREVIVISSVKWEMKGNLGYIKITQFGDDTTKMIKEAAQDLAAKNPQGIILDLRNNPGGYLDASVDVVSVFVASGEVVVKEEYKDGHQDELKTTLKPQLKDVPIVVLVNEGSASASEIVAGALRDLRDAKIVGQKTFGKGTVQELENLDSGSVLRISVARWLTPKGKAIDKEGIMPDIEVEQSSQDEISGKDLQLEKALEILTN